MFGGFFGGGGGEQPPPLPRVEDDGLAAKMEAFMLSEKQKLQDHTTKKNQKLETLVMNHKRMVAARKV